MFCVTTNRATPISIPKQDTRITRTETKCDYNNFDPFAKSPPNDFLRKLTQRITIHDNKWSSKDQLSTLLHTNSFNFKKE